MRRCTHRKHVASEYKIQEAKKLTRVGCLASPRTQHRTSRIGMRTCNDALFAAVKKQGAADLTATDDERKINGLDGAGHAVVGYRCPVRRRDHYEEERKLKARERE